MCQCFHSLYLSLPISLVVSIITSLRLSQCIFCSCIMLHKKCVYKKNDENFNVSKKFKGQVMASAWCWSCTGPGRLSPCFWSHPWHCAGWRVVSARFLTVLTRSSTRAVDRGTIAWKMMVLKGFAELKYLGLKSPLKEQGKLVLGACWLDQNGLMIVVVATALWRQHHAEYLINWHQ